MNRAKAYAPVLDSMLDVLEQKLDAAELDQVLRSAGRRMAPAGPPAQGDTATCLAAAVDLLNSMGGLAELQRDDEGYIIRGYSCPLAAITANHPEACHLAESLISAAIDLPLAECCEHGDQPRCCFRPAPAG